MNKRGNEMKRIGVLVLGLLWSSIASGAVSLRVCEADSSTPFDGRQIMVGTKLTIFVDSDSAATDWGGGIDLIKPINNPDPPIGKLFGRGWDSEALDYVNSHFPAAGDFAAVIDWENQDQQSFELSAAGQNKAPGTWFVLDYNAMNIGDCTIKLVEYHGPEIVSVMSETFYQVATRDFNRDGKVNFADFAKLASYWRHTDCGGLNNCEGTNLNPDIDSRVDFADLALFADYWLGYRGQQGSDSGMHMAGGIDQGSELVMADSFFAQSQLTADYSESIVTGEGQIPSIYLVYNGNMTPNPGEEVTIYIKTDTPIFVIDVWAMVAGDASLTAAMNTADCSQYGWDPSWRMDSYIDTDGWMNIGGVIWPGETSGIVGYFKFRYNGGQVSVSIYAEGSTAFDAYSQPVLFSAEPLIFGREP